MKIISGKTFADIYSLILFNLINHPEYETAPRGMKINEITNFGFELKNPYSCLYKNERRSSQYKYIAAELLWYLTGDNNVEFISRYSKFWQTIANNDGTLNSAYGHLIFKDRFNQENLTQWQWAYQSLVNDINTRQAIMHFNKPNHQYFSNKDFVCTMFGNFMIRENKLYFTVDMRSNDAILGLPTDLPFFCLLHINMYNLLKKNCYPDLHLGSYTHIVQSMHIYERNFDLVKNMLNYNFIQEEIPNDAKNVIDEIGNPTSFIKSCKDFILYGNQTKIKEDKTDFEKFITNELNITV